MSAWNQLTSLHWLSTHYQAEPADLVAIVRDLEIVPRLVIDGVLLLDEEQSDAVLAALIDRRRPSQRRPERNGHAVVRRPEVEDISE